MQNILSQGGLQGLHLGILKEGKKIIKKLIDKKEWELEYQNNNVFILNDKQFYSLLTHGQLSIEQIDLLLLDEVQEEPTHYYQLIHNYLIKKNCLNYKKPLKMKVVAFMSA